MVLLTLRLRQIACVETVPSAAELGEGGGGELDGGEGGEGLDGGDVHGVDVEGEGDGGDDGRIVCCEDTFCCFFTAESSCFDPDFDIDLV